jgi:hypothetical protein
MRSYVVGNRRLEAGDSDKVELIASRHIPTSCSSRKASSSMESAIILTRISW